MDAHTLALATAYLAAWDRRDLSEIAQFIHPGVRFIGPMTDLSGKEAFLQSTARILPMLQGVKVHTRFATSDQAICTYDFVCAAPINVCRTAELMTFENDLIVRIELFYDARPFEALARKRTESATVATL